MRISQSKALLPFAPAELALAQVSPSWMIQFLLRIVNVLFADAAQVPEFSVFSFTSRYLEKKRQVSVAVIACGLARFLTTHSTTFQLSDVSHARNDLQSHVGFSFVLE